MTGCANAQPGADNAPPGTAPSTPAPVTSSSVPASSSVPVPSTAGDDPSATAGNDKRAAFLGALREAGVPVSPSGAREIQIAQTTCAMVDRGMTPEQLASALVARYGMPDAQATRLVTTVISTYC